MNTYHYVAKDKNGRTVTGDLAAVSESEVGDTLHKKELVIVSIEVAKGQAKPPVKDKKVRLVDLIIFIRQLATLVDSGVTLVHALNIMTEQIENKTLKGVVLSMRQDIEEGTSFSETLAKYPHIFSELFMNMVRAGEVSGSLPEVLDRLATYLEKSASLNSKIRSSLAYPAVVVTMAVIITAVLLLKVVPIFKGIFEMLGGKLPLPTQILIMISDSLRSYFLLSVILLAVSVFLFKKFINTEKGRYIFDMQKLKAPILGPLFSKLAIAKFSRTFSTLVKSGVAILSALEIVSKTSGNKVVEEALRQCSKGVRDGEPISQPLLKGKVFPPLVCSMISVGEKTGQLEKMLTKIADFYEEQVDAAASALTSMIEPLVIVLLGTIIGGIVISLFLPIFKITELISK
ncbi:MAG: type II secretion system F family protein [Candidatus Omnitrophota bacterium]|nr:type II secretion system F family protein [Candidatus Omnitrophota bacterium]